MSQRDFNTDRDLSILEEHVETLHAALRTQAEGALRREGAKITFHNLSTDAKVKIDDGDGE